MVLALAGVAIVAPADPVSAAGPGTSYYLDDSAANCSDSGAGTSESAPWCTLAAASRGYAAGDRLLIARGSSYSGQFLTVSGQGTADARITIGTYGSGNRPVLSGATQPGKALVVLENPSFVSVSGLELSDAGVGAIAQYRASFPGSPTGNQSVQFSDLVVHNISGIGSSRVNGGPQDFRCHSNSLDLWQSGGVAVSGDFDLPVPSDSYFVSGVDVDNVVGYNNLNVVNIDNCDGRVGNPNNPAAASPQLVRNVTLNNVDAFDGDGSGYAQLCNEGMRFDGVTGLRVTNSTFKKLAACHVNGGTAGIILVAVDNVTFANNVISDVPNTSSNDETAIDDELYVNNVTLKDNLIARNAGPGVEFLSLRSGIADYNTNHVISGNTFFGNGGGSLHRLDLTAGKPFSGTITNNLVGDATFLNPAEKFESLIPANADNVQGDDTIAPSYSADQFGPTQGGGGWSYRLGNDQAGPSSWTNASFASGDRIYGVWSDGGSHRIGAFEQTAGTERVWTAPSDGTVAIRSLAFKSRTGGAPVTARILRNGAVVSTASVAATNTTGANLDGQLKVVAGDRIEFVLAGASGTSGADDWTSWVPSVMYQAKPSTSVGGLRNGGFETPYVSGYRYAPADNAWSFPASTSTGGDGIVANGSAFGNAAATQGRQAAFLQGGGSMSQTVKGLAAGAPYQVSFDVARRRGQAQTVQVLWDGTAVGSVTPPASSDYTSYVSPSFTTTAGDHTLTLRGVVTSDKTAFVDDVALTMVVRPSADVAFSDPSFEQSRVSGIAYGATGSPWAFVRNQGDGIAANGSAFQQANAPDGTQVGFVQGPGSFSQTVSGFVGGKSYAIAFLTAQRRGNREGIEVLVDGTSVGTITPSGTAWTQYATSSFTPGAGSHVITFRGTSPADQTVLVDVAQLIDAEAVASR